jgi:hypothetical protein
VHDAVRLGAVARRRADLAFVGGLASGAAGLVHLAVAPEHVRTWWASGAFFIVVGIAQLLSGPLLLRRPSVWLTAAVVAGNAALVLLYVTSRTVGLPIGPAHDGGHRAEPSGPADLLATAAEVVVLAALVPLLAGRARRVAVDLLLVCGLGLWVLRALGSSG